MHMNTYSTDGSSLTRTGFTCLEGYIQPPCFLQAVQGKWSYMPLSVPAFLCQENNSLHAISSTVADEKNNATFQEDSKPPHSFLKVHNLRKTLMQIVVMGTHHWALKFTQPHFHIFVFGYIKNPACNQCPSTFQI